MRRIHLGGSHQRDSVLTERQRAVLQLIAAGKTNAEIGEALGISLDGAKWHVTEILTRLQVQTREQAADWWRHEQSVLQRASRLFSQFRPMTALGGIALGGTVLAAVGVGAVVMLMRPGDAPASPPPTVPAVAPTVVPVAPTPTATPSTLVADGPVAFTVCSQQNNYRKLTVAEMQDVFTNKRFGDGVKPFPVDWGMYESNYYWIEDPHAVSANIENAAFSQGKPVGESPATPVQNPNCPTPDSRQDQSYQALWLYDHRVVSMSAESGILTVEVEPAGGTFENVEFPHPSAPRDVRAGKNAILPFVGLRVVDAAGHVLAIDPGLADEWEFGDQGAVLSGLLNSRQTRTPVPFRVGADLDLVCDQLPTLATTVTFASTQGSDITTHAAACTAPWQVAASVHLQPGDWTVTLDGDAYYTVLPKDGPRP